MMNNKEFAKRAENIARNYNTSYFLGAFGFQATNKNIKRLLNQCPENYNWLSQAENADWLFDCVNLLKAIIWGWNGSDTSYGGAIYCSNGMPDIDADSLHAQCSSMSSDFSSIEVGEILLMPGHCGIYIGNGKAVESTPSWSCGVQITAVGNIGTISGLNTRCWKSHGKLKQIDYSSESEATILPPGQSTQVAFAQYFDRNLAGKYVIQTGGYGLNLRKDANTDADIIKAFPDGTVVTNYGYYSIDKITGIKWLLVTVDGHKGFMSTEYLYK